MIKINNLTMKPKQVYAIDPHEKGSMLVVMHDAKVYFECDDDLNTYGIRVELGVTNTQDLEGFRRIGKNTAKAFLAKMIGKEERILELLDVLIDDITEG